MISPIDFTPSPEDYEIKAWTRGKRVIIEADSPAQARSFRRQIVDLMQGGSVQQSSIGFQVDNE